MAEAPAKTLVSLPVIAPTTAPEPEETPDRHEEKHAVKPADVERRLTARIIPVVRHDELLSRGPKQAVRSDHKLTIGAWGLSIARAEPQAWKRLATHRARQTCAARERTYRQNATRRTSGEGCIATPSTYHDQPGVAPGKRREAEGSATRAALHSAA